jgi:hypothetical protein
VALSPGGLLESRLYTGGEHSSKITFFEILEPQALPAVFVYFRSLSNDRCQPNQCQPGAWRPYDLQ